MLTDNFKDNFSFSGKAARSQYWATLIITLVVFVLGSAATESSSAIMVLVGLVALVATLWAVLAVTAKRCRDCGLNPWWTAATLIPFVAAIVIVVLGCLSTQNSEG